MTYFPEFEDYNTGADAYVRHVEACKRELEIPVIASLNGISQGGWVGQARRIQEAGADALELNVYFLAADPDETADDVEMRYVKLVEAVRGEISIPLAVKIGPFFSSIGHMAHRLVAAGADGLVLFNRFMQPDIDLEELTDRPDPAPLDVRRSCCCRCGGSGSSATASTHRWRSRPGRTPRPMC